MPEQKPQERQGSREILKKYMIDLSLLIIGIIITLIVYAWYAQKASIGFVEQTEIEHAKRLYGSAWKEAMKLGD